MAIHVRRKRNVTPRFKPDMWGRDPGSEGEVLFDGTVTFEDVGQGVGADGITLSDMPEIGKTVIITLNGVEYSGVAEDDEGDVVVLVKSGDSGVFLDAHEGEASISCSEDVGSIGENTLKIVQSE